MSVLLQKVVQYVQEEYSRPHWAEFDYHNLSHSHNVAREVKYLAQASKLSKKEIEILEIAAWFHDLGYEQGVVGHEMISIEISKAFLIKENAPEETIDQVSALIKATCPEFKDFQSLSQKIICDADLSNAGLKGFKKCSKALRKEWFKIQDRKYSTNEWALLQVQFLSNLNYLSEAGKIKYNKRKSKNLKKYEKKVTKKSSSQH
ncbi:MAG: HD domain-containing protein [Saprospiraceae bacterium]